MNTTTNILDALARSSGISVSAIRYGSRMRQCVYARQVGAWLVRNMTGASYPETGIALGRAHHTTMMHSCKQVDKDIRTAGPRLDVLLRFIDTATKEK